MSITRAEFLRSLEAMVGAEAMSVDGHRIESGNRRRGWEFVLTPLPERRIALLALPVMRVELRLRGFAPEECADFERQFDLCFRRGGG